MTASFVVASGDDPPFMLYPSPEDRSRNLENFVFSSVEFARSGIDASMFNLFAVVPGQKQKPRDAKEMTVSDAIGSLLFLRSQVP